MISLVAWNWAELSGAAKLALGAGALVAAYLAGHWLAQVDGRPLLGSAWRGIHVVTEPGEASPDRLWLRATWHAGRAVLDQTGRLYMNEEQCRAADELLLEGPDQGLVVLAVDEYGNLSPRRLHIAGHTFGSGSFESR